MMVWLHSKSPPQHIANVPEITINTAEKLRTYMAQTNERHGTNLKWGGVFENDGPKLWVALFWDVEAAEAYCQRNADLLLLISTTDA